MIMSDELVMESRRNTHTHTGLMVILGMFGTYVHCNQTIKKEVSLKVSVHLALIYVVIVLGIIVSLYSYSKCLSV